MNVLVATDLSPVTIRMLNQARRLAQRLDARVWLVHVAAARPEFIGFEVGPVYVRDFTAHALRRVHARIQRMAARWRDAGLETSGVVVRGATAEALLREAERVGAELILMGTHGHGVGRGHWIGRVVRQVVRGANCPVVLIPSRR